jgi:DMSO reductase family type II enzyme heme b subunit
MPVARLVRGKLTQAIVIMVAAYLVFRFGIRPPIPLSLFVLYMAITLIAVLAYVSADEESLQAFLRPLGAVALDEAKRPVRVSLMVAFPILAGMYAYAAGGAAVSPPAELRAIHPAPPTSISFRGKEVQIQGLDNPFRHDTANFERYVAEGAAIYSRNCVFCHGDTLDGKGIFAHGFNPSPANFTDTGTIAQLQESYLFWRISKGGPGLPSESAPWSSAMPAWEDRLTGEEIWNVIMYLYWAAGVQPRRWEVADNVTSDPVAPTAKAAGERGVGSWYSRDARSLRTGRGLAEAAVGSELGARVYMERCSVCHGIAGKGDGPAASFFSPKPRDFTRGFYKIRTTATGQLPTDRDLFRLISEGMPGTSMPSWRHLPEEERWALVAHLKTFSPRFRKETPGKAIDVGRDIPATEESIEKGRKLYQLMECFTCHGNAGRGDGESAPTLEDDWENPIRARNLTRAWTYRGGNTSREIVMRFLTGLAGTPMPSYEGVVEMEENWHLANYVRSLSPSVPNYATLIAAKPTAGEIPLDPVNTFWSAIPGANFPLVGQVIVDPRNFTPSIDMVTVRAAYSNEQIAFHLAWDDPTRSRPGKPKEALADAIAIEFPAQLPEGRERPYFVLGDAAAPVYLLEWRSDGGVREANARGVGKVVPLKQGDIQVKGQVVYKDGRYQLVIRRPRAAPDRANVLAFPVGRFIPIAFVAWDGNNGEAGNKMSLSSWYYLRLEPPPSQTRWLYPPLAAFGVLGLELWGFRWARRRVRR